MGIHDFDDGGRTRVGNTPTCEDCGEALDACTCDEDTLCDLCRTAEATLENELGMKFCRACVAKMHPNATIEGAQ